MFANYGHYDFEGSGMSDQALAEDRIWGVEHATYYLGVPVQTLYSWRG